jgi:hypothetical protein
VVEHPHNKAVFERAIRLTKKRPGITRMLSSSAMNASEYLTGE